MGSCMLPLQVAKTIAAKVKSIRRNSSSQTFLVATSREVTSMPSLEAVSRTKNIHTFCDPDIQTVLSMHFWYCFLRFFYQASPVRLFLCRLQYQFGNRVILYCLQLPAKLRRSGSWLKLILLGTQLRTTSVGGTLRGC